MSADVAIWFVGSDVCTALGILNAPRALSRLPAHQKTQPKNTNGYITAQFGTIRDTLGRLQTEQILITEGGVYRLIFRSRKPQAIKFTDWVSDDVLPELRRHGAYRLPDNSAADPPEPNPERAVATRILAEIERCQTSGEDLPAGWLTGALPDWIAEHQPEYIAAAVDRAIENTLNDAGAKAASIVSLILDATESLAMARQTRAPLTLAAPAAAPASDTRRPDRIGFTTAIAWIPLAAKTELRLLAVAEGKSAETLIREALNLLFANRGKPPLA